MTCYADQACYVLAPILENVPIAQDTWRIRLESDRLAQHVVPGQFYMVRNPASNDPLIGRAFAIYDVDPDRQWIDLVYLVKGKLTRSLARLGVGAEVAVWGPLGNGFPVSACDHLIMVAGGIGQTPFLALAREALGLQQYGDPPRANGYSRRVTFCYGVRTAAMLADVDRFEATGCRVLVATEDGSQGAPRLATDLLAQVIEKNTAGGTRIACCGPEPMMEAVARIARQAGIPCQVSLETPMACGIGICFSCVARVGSAADWDYKRTCVEGPVFDAEQIVW